MKRTLILFFWRWRCLLLHSSKHYERYWHQYDNYFFRCKKCGRHFRIYSQYRDPRPKRFSLRGS